MTIFIEISRPFQPKPWKFKSRLCYRVGWGWFAFTWLRVSFYEYTTADKQWVSLGSEADRKWMAKRNG